MLHDLLEDCPEWNEKSLSCLFGENIVKTIVLLTKQKNQKYSEYIDAINQSSWATKIKLADLKDNMDITRLNSVSEKDIERLNKYIEAFKILSAQELNREQLSVYGATNELLVLFSVSNSVATDYAEFCVKCDREKLPLLCLEDYIKQYCC